MHLSIRFKAPIHENFMFIYLLRCLRGGLRALLHPSTNAPDRLAMLVDADGISPKQAAHVFDHADKLGRVRLRRVYGNFSGGALSDWSALLREQGCIVRHMPPLVPGKNATDIALTIDAVDLLPSRNIDGIVIVSSDTDFAPLARRVQEAGKKAVVFGKRTTPIALQRSCNVFIDFEALGDEKQASMQSRPTLTGAPSEAEQIVLYVLGELCGPEGGPVPLATLGGLLARDYPDFNKRAFGRRKLSNLLKEIPSVALTTRGSVVYVAPTRSLARNG